MYTTQERQQALRVLSYHFKMLGIAIHAHLSPLGDHYLKSDNLVHGLSQFYTAPVSFTDDGERYWLSPSQVDEIIQHPWIQTLGAFLDQNWTYLEDLKVFATPIWSYMPVPRVLIQPNFAYRHNPSPLFMHWLQYHKQSRTRTQLSYLHLWAEYAFFRVKDLRESS